MPHTDGRRRNLETEATINAAMTASPKKSLRRLSAERAIPYTTTAVEQVVACTLVTQRARVRSPVWTSFLDEVFSGFFLSRKTNVGKLSTPNVPEYHLTIFIIHTHSLRAPMT